MEIYTITKKRTITAEQQHVCDVCQEPATTGCTDAIETATGWTQSPQRYGCQLHPVTPVTRNLNDSN